MGDLCIGAINTSFRASVSPPETTLQTHALAWVEDASNKKRNGLRTLGLPATPALPSLLLVGSQAGRSLLVLGLRDRTVLVTSLPQKWPRASPVARQVEMTGTEELGCGVGWERL